MVLSVTQEASAELLLWGSVHRNTITTPTSGCHNQVIALLPWHKSGVLIHIQEHPPSAATAWSECHPMIMLVQREVRNIGWIDSVIKRHSVSSKQVLCLKWLFFYSEKLVSRLSNNWPFWNVPSRPDVHLCAFNCKLYAGITTTLLGKCLTSSGFNYCISSAAGGRSPVADSGMWDSAP